jgi:hypothetical protein
MQEIIKLKAAVVGSNIKRHQKLEIIRNLNMLQNLYCSKNGYSVLVEMSEAEARKVVAKLENEREFKARRECINKNKL